jgi:ribosomal protein S18 acetylase RimI-like enzyme
MLMTTQQWSVRAPHGELAIRQALHDDVATLVAIDEEAARWVRSLGIEPGEAPRPLSEIFAEAVARGEMYLALRDGVPAGKITLQARDTPLWAGIPGDALYVHGLTAARAFAGQEIGRALLRWAEDMARERGRAYLRLDCNADNPALRAYYERAGFVHCGDVQLAHRQASRYEKGVTEGRHGTDAL